MADVKTKPTDVAVEEFIARIEELQKRADSHTLIEIMQRITGAPPRMWGPSIVGFGSFTYKYASGHEGISCLTGFSPRKAEFSIYLNGAYDDAARQKREALLAKLGKHRMGKGCLYVKRLEGLDLKILGQLVKLSVDEVRAAYGD